MTAIGDVLHEADTDFEGSVSRLLEFLRIPSISTDPAYREHCLKAARWTQGLLEAMGFAAHLAPTPANPVVIGRYEPDQVHPGMLHILLYGHYDVQPPDPIELWKTPPFEPSRRKEKDGIERIYARGACDDKGQVMTMLEASRAWLRNRGRLPFRVTALIEGDEESDCSHLDDFLKRHRKELKADLALVCDTSMWSAGVPAITTRLRGCLNEEVHIRGPRIDLHSGGYGPAAANPIHVLCRVLSELRDGNGRIRIPRFYEGVEKVPARTLAQWRKLGFDNRKFLRAVGLEESKGEKGYSILEQLWARPTAEINGIIGGYTGEGGKTVIPSEASAKLTFRLVGSQDPAAIRKAFRSFVKDRVPEDCSVRFSGMGGNGAAIELAEDDPFLTRAAAALKAEWRREPARIGSGGSIPIVESFKRVLGMNSILTGFSLEDDGAHSPNEKYNVSSYRRGIRSWIRIFDALAGSAR
ncbi:MAG: M20/M25/M40 family metallo-hydrolase [Pseudomonadota bacterium]|nr:M20/M25/M40 family metallo-hydrolase [Pseudomonadota bacterium]